VQCGLSSRICCVRICERQHRVYVGTAEGQVLIFTCDKGYPLLRVLSYPDDISAISCIHRSTGVLAVGTQGGSVHLHVLSHLRLAGSINIARLLPESQSSGGTAGIGIRHIRLVAVPAEDRLPLTLLTVDVCSRVQLWGLRLDEHSGKLVELKLMCGRGLLRAEDPGGSILGMPPQSSTEGDAGGVNITAISVVWGQVAQAKDVSEEAAAKSSAQQAAEARASTPFLTEAHNGAGAGGGSDGEAEDDGSLQDVVAARLGLRPETPPSDARKGYRAVNGRGFVFLADASGWLWRLDIAASLAAARAASLPVAVPLKTTAEEAALRPPQVPLVGLRERARTSSSAYSMSTGKVSLASSKSQLEQHSEVAMTLCITEAWCAHKSAIVSLVPSGPPPALVSVDVDKEVRIWSVIGDLWGCFSLVPSSSGAAPSVTVWPPPQVLATQVALMRTAKKVCRQMGLLTVQSTDNSFNSMTKPRRSRKTVHPSSLAADALAAEETAAPPSMAAVATAAFAVVSAGVNGGAGKGAGPDDPPAPAASAVVAASATSRSEVAATEAPLPVEPAEPETAEVVAGRPGSEAEGEEGATFGGEGEASGSQQEAGRAVGGESKRKQKGFTPEQMSTMVRHHAFSTGCQSYQQFTANLQLETEQPSPLHLASALRDLEALRNDFLARPTSGLGVTIGSLGATEPAEVPITEASSVTASGASSSRTGRSGLGRRSTSDSALLRYARGTSEEMTRAVRENLGVDVTKTSLRRMRGASFVASLDVMRVSGDASDPMSATAQAAKRLCSKRRRSRTNTESSLVSAGRMSVGK